MDDGTDAQSSRAGGKTSDRSRPQESASGADGTMKTTSRPSNNTALKAVNPAIQSRDVSWRATSANRVVYEAKMVSSS